MLRLFGKTELPRPLRTPIVTLGTFDGVHLGHQKVLQETIAWAKEIGGESTVMTFYEPPRVLLSGEVPLTLTSLEHRLTLFERLGLDVSVVLEFSRDLAETTAEEFAEEYLSRWLGARGVLLGYDCRFGRGARGNVDLLRALAPKLGFQVRACEQLHTGHLLPSSTAIREAIISGNLRHASAMLGRPVSILGEVVPGDRIGRTLGFPTANIVPHHEVIPPHGIYACTVDIGGREYLAVTSIGVRPTVTDRPELRIETYVVDFQGDLYGRELEVRFLERLRDEVKFGSIEELRAQIARDVQTARRVLIIPATSGKPGESSRRNPDGTGG